MEAEDHPLSLSELLTALGTPTRAPGTQGRPAPAWPGQRTSSSS
jgi:hypothetical protein